MRGEEREGGRTGGRVGICTMKRRRVEKRDLSSNRPLHERLRVVEVFSGGEAIKIVGVDKRGGGVI